ncbi:MAG TPA: MarR family transcriptional regulator [Solirubrobacteraceae bacterium]|nr:MarR family transcriptional regulator [Solirubrobacteraceae bacterium]
MDAGDETAAAALARELGTSTPRVVRAAQRLGFDSRPLRPGRTAQTGSLRLSEIQVQRLRTELGVKRVLAPLTDAETAALAALARTPFGLMSARAVARNSGLSPTTAATAVKSLQGRGLLTTRQERIVAGRSRTVQMLYANRSHPLFRALSGALSQVQPPAARRDAEVPSRLRHLFWNTAPEQLDVDRHGQYIARRLLRSLDPAGLAWGASNLRGADWLAAAQARGLDARTQALANNLAHEAGL